jgi:hypothetical protein
VDAERDAYDELYVYTMGRGRERFVLQHVVDAFAAQTAEETTPPIGIIFALIGLYLHVERGFSGARVQQAHMALGRNKRQWPAIVLPKSRGALKPSDALAAPAGDERDLAIERWCQSVWAAYADSRATIVELVRFYQLV